jgi:hypothetical protein
VEKYLFGDAPNVDSSEETTVVLNVALLDRKGHLQDLFVLKYALGYLRFLKSNMFCGVVQTYSTPASKSSFTSLTSLLACYYDFPRTELEQFFLF